MNASLGDQTRIAVVGMSARLPGAGTIDAYWRNLCDGVETTTFFSRQDLIDAGADPALVDRPNYVRARAILPDLEKFDAAFFGLSPREAALLDPQQRILLECAWEAIECSGCARDVESRQCGVYAGVGMNGYFLNNIWAERTLFDSVGGFQVMLANDKDFCATRISYKLNLKGPSISVQTACSTSLVAVHLACQALLQGECDIALAGGCAAFVPQRSGYMYEPGMILSPDGHCRPFDAGANGTVPGSGAGIVVLKRLDDALKDGDCIQAVILGSAANNDGSIKIGYTAPSAEGQRNVISEALAVAGVSPDSIGYIEAHGTGTPQGDPIEFEALMHVFGSASAAPGKCALGSVKSNFGHLDVASGVAGLVKAVLALRNGLIPGTLHFQRPNPAIDLEQSPFFIPTKPVPWNSDRSSPRRASVSSFGIGGTNAHVVLEQPPVREQSKSSRCHHSFVLSAKSASALETAGQQLAEHLRAKPDCELADVAFALNVGRRIFAHRRLISAADCSEAIKQIEQAPAPEDSRQDEVFHRRIVFLFPGQGTQYPRMAKGLYQAEPLFREQIDHCAEILRSELEHDLRDLLFQTGSPDPAQAFIHQTRFAQPALFAVEYSLARCLMQWQVRPHAMLGHSLGEWVAACIAGVMTLKEALHLIVERARLMQEQPEGAMLAVPLDEAALTPYLRAELDLAAVNAPKLCTVAGPFQAISVLERDLSRDGVASMRLVTSHAFHSAMMEPVVEPVLRAAARLTFQPPQIRFVSSTTGCWITRTEATDPSYWANQLRRTVRCKEGLELLFRDPEQVLLEMGPGRTLSNLISRNPERSAAQPLFQTFPSSRSASEEGEHLVAVAARLHMAGVPINWNVFYQGEGRRRLWLPPHPFRRERCWIDPPGSSANHTRTPTTEENVEPRQRYSDWFYLPGWRRSALPQPSGGSTNSGTWLLVGGESEPFIDRELYAFRRVLAAKLCEQNANVVNVRRGKHFAHSSPENCAVRSEVPDDWSELLGDLQSTGRPLRGIIILEGSLGLRPWNDSSTIPRKDDETSYCEFLQLIALAQAIGRTQQSGKIYLICLSRELHLVNGTEQTDPRRALALGALRVIPQEYQNIVCRNIDIDTASLRDGSRAAGRVMAEILSDSSDDIVVYRGALRWIPSFEQVKLAGLGPDTRLRHHGVYLITGGLGGVGLTLAKHLAESYRAKLILVSRSGFPDRTQWERLSEEDHQSGVGRRARSLLEIEAFGGEVFIIPADVANEEQMANAITESERRFGSIHGVIHAAGIPGGGILASKTSETALSMMRAKVEGTLVLDQLFANRHLDFLMLCSSVAGWLGGFGQADYCAANAFLDAYAAFKSRQEQPAFAVAWDTWREVGMAVETEAPSELRRLRDDELRRYALAPSEGFSVFRQVLQLGLPQVVISTRDFHSRYSGRNHVIVEGLKKLGRSVSGPRHRRPDLVARFVLPRDDFERRLAEHWCENLGFSEIGVNDNYFDLGGDSLKGISLVSRLQQELGEIIHVTALFEAPTVAELAAYFVKHYRAIVRPLQESARPVPVDAVASGLDRNRVEQLRQQISVLPPYPERPGSKNPRALFVLAPPRSGSTLLRVMLAGHPELFAPPELALLSFNTLRERKDALNHAPSLLDGPVHALKQLRNWTVEEASSYMSELERRDLSCKECYLELQRLLPGRLLVDKTPNYAYDLETLRRAEADFERPLYIHLVRHPCGMIHSYAEAKLDLLLPREDRETVGLPREQFAEAIWLISHQNILRFLDEIPAGRHLRLKFEDLLLRPRAEMDRLCAFLGIEFHPGILEPYRETRQRMTEGLRSNSRMLGDVNFHRHRGIEPEVADKWRSLLREEVLSEMTQTLARRLDYKTAREEQSENVAVPIPIIARPPEGTFAMSSGQRRLWFLHQMDGQSAVYHMPGALRIRGPLDVSTLAECHREIIRRHDTLRTTFTTVDGVPRQVVAEDIKFQLPVIDISHLPREERGHEARKIVSDCAQRPFDLSQGPLLRAVVVRLSEEDHVWAVTTHHIVSDGWSLSVFVREMTSLYRTYAVTEARPLPDLPIQYVDYAAWQADWLRSEKAQKQISYWQKALAGAPPLLPLPYDRPRPAIQTNRGGVVRFTLDAGLSAKLKAAARDANGTLFTTLLAGFAALLSRYSKLDDIVVGTPTAGRNRPEFAPLIGFFVNTLVLRIDLSANPTFRELLQQARRVFLDAITHQDVPFEKLVEALQPPRNLSQTPVFQVMFGLRNIDTGELDWPGLALEPIDLDHQTAAFDLTLLMKEVPTGLIGDFEYNADLFDESTIREFGHRFEILLRAWINGPDRCLKEVSLTESSETSSLLEAWNSASSSEITSGSSVEDLFTEQAARSPLAIAVAGMDPDREALTYTELNRYADRLARILAEHGAGPEVAVGLCVERSPEMIVALLGILKAGAAFAPLDPGYPRERVEFMIRDARIKVIVAHDRFVSHLPEAGITFISADQILTSRDAVSGPPPAKALPENVAYLIYTSGSTGQPKAVMVERRSMTAFVRAATQHYTVSSADRFLQFASISFDAAIEEIFPTLISGGTLVIRNDETLNSIGSFLSACEDHQITVLDLPTVFWHRLAAELPSLRIPESVRMIIIGGEALQTPHVDQWRHWGPKQIRVVNSYGPTEATVVATCYDLSGPLAQNCGPVTALIGRGLPHARVYLLDDHLHPVPPGVPGEICIGGGALARGYRDRPDLTAERFWPDPFSNQPGARLYRTKDLARSRLDGTLEFLGRSDRQIKIRGFRVELDEIQSTLTTHPALAQAVAVAREDGAGNKRLGAYVVSRAKAPITERAIREWLGQRLPSYMVPASIINLETIPTTPQGKVDYRALPEDTEEFAPDASSQGSSDPRNEIEATLVRIWAEVLRIKAVGVHDNFFELGGDSILCLQVVAQARGAGLRLTSRQLFERQTISQLATVAQGVERNDDHPPETGPFPLTPIQHWFFEQNFADPEHFNQAAILEIAPSVTAEQLTDAFRALVRRHDALRMRFTGGAGQVLTTIEAGDATSFEVERISLNGLQREQQISEIENRAEALQKSLSLDSGPLMRTALFQLGDTQPSRLLWIIHHLAVDGVSWRILLRELEIALSTGTNGQNRVDTPASISFGAWARLLVPYANSLACERELDYWLQLAPKRVPRLFREYNQGTNPSGLRGEANLTTLELETEETAALLREAPAAYQCGIDDILLTALVRSVTEWTGERQLLLDLESHGRQELFQDADVSETVGWFTTVYPVCLSCDIQASVAEQLRHVQTQLRQVPHHGFHYGLLRYLHHDGSIREKLAALPQADLLFNYFGQLDQALPASRILLHRANESHGPTASPRQRRTHLIELNAWISQGRLTTAWTFDRSLSRLTIERLGYAFLDSISELIAAADSASPDETSVSLGAGRVDARKVAKVSAVLRKADSSRSLQQ